MAKTSSVVELSRNAPHRHPMAWPTAPADGFRAGHLTAQEDGATESDLHDAVAEAIADAYFRQGGGGRAGLEVEFTDVEWLNIAF
ncbi:hypothetical protein ACFXKS_39080 [Streptomyces scopuliridis]|uniref:hypothetical protein n=1 Tax=Streptomyces scopuliridis TaxID=452529 RepID=UPI0036A17A5F